MRTIPFYNHYFGEGNATAKQFNNVLKPNDIELEEKPCLCQLHSREIVLPNLVLIHGERLARYKSECYARIREFISNNPNTQFYMFAFGMEEEGIEKRIGTPSNCIAIMLANLEQCFDDIKRIAKQTQVREEGR